MMIIGYRKTEDRGVRVYMYAVPAVRPRFYTMWWSDITLTQ